MTNRMQRQYQREWYENNPDYNKLYNRNWRKVNPESGRKSGKKYRLSHKELLKKINDEYRMKLKSDVIRIYSSNKNECFCCHEKDIRFLVIDHVNGRKSEGHDKKMTGYKLYLWLKKNNYPKGYQVLCQNCNFSKFIHGECIHTVKLENLVKGINNIEIDLRKKIRRLNVITVYSNGVPQCSCCGELEYDFLVIDHVNKRKNLGHDRSYVSDRLYRWLESNSFPEGFQVLCHKCNLAKTIYDGCPHRKFPWGR